jgi:Leucine-rich repeat (LRR) protein
MGKKIKNFSMLVIAFTVILLLWFSCTPPADNTSPVVEKNPYIEDLNLLAAIKDALPEGSQVNPDTMATISTLKASNRGIRTLTGIQYLTKLDNLDLSNNSLADISPLALREASTDETLIRLTKLNLSGNKGCATFPDFWNVIKSLNKLQSLDVSAIGFTGSFPNLAIDNPLPELTDLKLANNSFTNIFFLCALTQLTSLDLGSNQSIDPTNLALLSLLANLEHLKLSGMKQSIYGSALFSFIKNMPHLISLDFSGSDIKRISNSINDVGQDCYLACPPSLKEIILANCESLNSIDLSNIDAVDLTNCKALAFINLTTSSLTDISSLAGIPSLKHLDLNSTNVSDISVLKDLSTITELILKNCPVSDITALQSLPGPAIINLTNCNVSDLAPLINNPGIGDLYIILTVNTSLTTQQIADLSAIAAHVEF